MKKGAASVATRLSYPSHRIGPITSDQRPATSELNCLQGVYDKLWIGIGLRTAACGHGCVRPAAERASGSRMRNSGGKSISEHASERKRHGKRTVAESVSQNITRTIVTTAGPRTYAVIMGSDLAAQSA